MNNKTSDQLLTELLELHTKHIQTLNERIEVLIKTIQTDKKTIKEQENSIASLKGALDMIKILNNKTNV